jgi:pimeloyl-ACP methyl ester carboxylesterase
MQHWLRLLLTLRRYNPGWSVKQVDVPILFVAGSRDQLCPSNLVRQAAEEAPHGEYFEVESAHFDLYMGDNFKAIIKRMLGFLERHLKTPESTRTNY